MPFRILFLCFSFCAIVHPLLTAGVQEVKVIERGDVLHGHLFGKAGPYEAIKGRVKFAVDPKLGPNRIITDIDLAPRNKAGLVEFEADLFVLKPRDPAKGNGTALLEISNRGGKGLLGTFDFARGALDLNSPDAFGDGFLLEQGYTLVWIGWECDIPAGPNLLHLFAPIAKQDGKTITGLVVSEWTGDDRIETIGLGDRTQIGYAVADPDSSENKIYVRDTVEGPRTLVPRTEWTFVDAEPDAKGGGISTNSKNRVRLNGGFAPGRIYEVVYIAKDPVVAGLGPAAVRDFASFLKYGGPETLPGDQHNYLKRSVAFGISQSGRFLRSFLYDGFNEDEKNRKVFDGVWAQVAGGGRGSFNERFAQPSRDGHPFLNVFYPVDLPPFDEEGLLERSRRAHVEPKVFLTNGSYEYWSRAASLIHTTPDGKADAPPSPNTRIYYFSGSQHGSGSLPPRLAPAQNPSNINDYRYGLRALLVAMQNWLVAAAEPPPSQFPRISEHQLVSLSDWHFPAIPGVALPAHKREAYRLDFTKKPVEATSGYPTLVPKVNADGNDLGGIAMPEVAAPLASYTGWNLRNAVIGGQTELFAMTGSWIPFAKNERERQATGDPRLSIAERYKSKALYLEKISAATADLIKRGYLLPEDAGSLHERAAKEWDYREGLQK
jgi:Alpha/beta hydrolase domain